MGRENSSEITGHRLVDAALGVYGLASMAVACVLVVASEALGSNQVSVQSAGREAISPTVAPDASFDRIAITPDQ